MSSPARKRSFKQFSYRLGIFIGANRWYIISRIFSFGAAEDGDQTRFVESFTWVKTPDHAPDNVKAIWQQEHSLCEARDGHTGIEGGAVHLIIGK